MATLTIDPLQLENLLREAASQDPTVYRLFTLLKASRQTDVTEIISEVLLVMSRNNKHLLSEVVRLTMEHPASVLKQFNPAGK